MLFTEMIDKQVFEKLLCQGYSEDLDEKVLQKSCKWHVPLAAKHISIATI